MVIIETISPDLAEKLCRKITADLPEYFGLPDANEHYAIGVRSCVNLAAKLESQYVGLLSINFPYPENANIYWMAVLRNFHGTGIGKNLAKVAFQHAKIKGAKTISVETLAPYESDENYRKTYQFYQSIGFSPLFNLKPSGYEWNMVYMVKSLGDVRVGKTPDVLIRTLFREDIPIVVKAFNKIGWNKTTSLFERYLDEAKAGERLIWLAFTQGSFAGYITLKWQSLYRSFKDQNIPEVMDLNVLPSYRKLGIGSRLLQVAEQKATNQCDTVGIGVGLYAGEDGGYGAAQRLYVKRGYIPDGKGVTYSNQPTLPGNSYPLDDDLVLWFTKKLR